MNLPPKLYEQQAAELRARAAEYGWVLAARCSICSAPIWNPKSIARHAGPVCAARSRHKESDAGSHTDVA